MKTATMLLLSMPLLAPVSIARAGELVVPEARTSAPATSRFVPTSETERLELEAAERASSAELVDLRGGDISNDTLLTILLVLGIVVLILILV